MANSVKTTVLMDENIHNLLVRRYGKRGISKSVNTLLKKALFKPKKGMYGCDPWLNMEIRDRHIDEHPDL